MSSEEKRFVKWAVILIVCIVAAVIIATLVMLYCPTSKQHTASPEQQVASISLKNAPRNIVHEIQVENSYTITATVYPETAEDKSLTWSVAFVDPNSSWAKGKTISNYVIITPSADTSKCEVQCKQPFGESVKITATSVSNNDIKAECLCEYLQQSAKIVYSSIWFGGSELTFDMSQPDNLWSYSDYGSIYEPYPMGNELSADEISFSCGMTTNDVCTIYDSYEYTYTFEATDEYKAKMQSAGGYTFSPVTGMLDNGSIVTDIPDNFAFGCYFPMMGLDDISFMLGDPIYIDSLKIDAKNVLKANPNMRFMKLTITATGSRITRSQTTYFKANASSL